jgi:hypothetical protein
MGGLGDSGDVWANGAIRPFPMDQSGSTEVDAKAGGWDQTMSLA